MLWYQKSLADGLDSAQKWFRRLEGSAQAMTRSAERLRALTGDRVEMNEVVDESLIGGVSVRIGDRLYDASVRSRLERLRARMSAV